MKEVIPIGEWQVGPGREIEFDSRPIATPGTTVDLHWGPVILRVRVRERFTMRSRGHVLSIRTLKGGFEPVRPLVRAADLLIEASPQALTVLKALSAP